MSATARGAGDGQTRQRRLDIFLNDHLAGATAGAELARRMAQEHGGSAYGNDLKNLAAEISQDRRTLLRLMADLDVPVKHYKVYGAWLGEKIGRVKPNGRLLRRSGLTALVELEALRLGAQGKALLWRALLLTAAQDSRLVSDRLEQLLQRVGQQIETLDSLHDRAATALLSTTPPLEATSESAIGEDTPS
ncbi:hypothetical protein GCM10010377_52220 [Streptomyces viridiviolaceus]|uniref:Uncharacterized protein n=1 Tax=Streptomyces viridiviolaceus TaxID=68282 RepID=A0ABW2E5M7_9ACTN|nr:hypothetical protein [Streptomyces viridiviolaceus]GHB54637.1 hypothetical protein GCM10010377_52220 [Streptomyces viridiviolaceus]